MNNRKTYIKPELVSHGTISQLTNGAKVFASPNDGAWLNDPHQDLQDYNT